MYFFNQFDAKFFALFAGRKIFCRRFQCIREIAQCYHSKQITAHGGRSSMRRYLCECNVGKYVLGRMPIFPGLTGGTYFAANTPSRRYFWSCSWFMWPMSR